MHPPPSSPRHPSSRPRTQVELLIAADLYAFAVMIWEMITGLVPFDGGKLSAAEVVEMLRLARNCNDVPAMLPWAYPGLMEERDGAEGGLMGIAKLLMTCRPSDCRSIGELREALEWLQVEVPRIRTAAAAAAAAPSVGQEQPAEVQPAAGEEEQKEAVVLMAEQAGQADAWTQPDQKHDGPPTSQQQQADQEEQLRAAM